jgi:hypothetical protein
MTCPPTFSAAESRERNKFGVVKFQTSFAEPPLHAILQVVTVADDDRVGLHIEDFPVVWPVPQIPVLLRLRVPGTSFFRGVLPSAGSGV